MSSRRQAPDRIAELLTLIHLSCPDDGRALAATGTGLRCEGCDRGFPLIEGQLLDLLPKEPLALSGQVTPGYLERYPKSWTEGLRLDPEVIPRCAPERLNPRAVQSKRHQVAWALPRLLQQAGPEPRVLCDISAGAGYYTLAYADHFDLVLHCDKSLGMLSYGLRQARANRIDNILFARIDYLRPPFRRALDRVICFATLVWGPDHETALLNAIGASLGPDGYAIVDFRNAWRNPLRRIGLWKKGVQHAYSRREAASLIRRAGLSRFRLEPFFGGSVRDRLFGRSPVAPMPYRLLVYRIYPSDSGQDLDDSRVTPDLK